MSFPGGLGFFARTNNLVKIHYFVQRIDDDPLMADRPGRLTPEPMRAKQTIIINNNNKRKRVAPYLLVPICISFFRTCSLVQQRNRILCSIKSLRFLPGGFPASGFSGFHFFFRCGLPPSGKATILFLFPLNTQPNNSRLTFCPIPLIGLLSQP